jgi:hypothetical protein
MSTKAAAGKYCLYLNPRSVPRGIGYGGKHFRSSPDNTKQTTRVDEKTWTIELEVTALPVTGSQD